MHPPEQDVVNQEEPASETVSKKPNPASSTDPVHHSLWEKHSQKSSGRLNMSTWDNPWLVGGSQQVLLQGVLSHQLVMQLTALCFSTSEAGLAEQIPHMTSTTMWAALCLQAQHSLKARGRGKQLDLPETETHLPLPCWLYFPCWGEENAAMQTDYCSCLLSSLPFLTGIPHSANRAICQRQTCSWI